jgi:cyanophycinase
VAQNPRLLGVGIDEDTAVVCDGGRAFTVLGAGGVCVVDGRDVTRSNVVEDRRDRARSVHDVRLHLLNVGDTFDLRPRRLAGGPAADAEARLVSSS